MSAKMGSPRYRALAGPEPIAKYFFELPVAGTLTAQPAYCEAMHASTGWWTLTSTPGSVRSSSWSWRSWTSASPPRHTSENRRPASSEPSISTPASRMVAPLSNSDTATCRGSAASLSLRKTACARSLRLITDQDLPSSAAVHIAHVAPELTVGEARAGDEARGLQALQIAPQEHGPVAARITERGQQLGRLAESDDGAALHARAGAPADEHGAGEHAGAGELAGVAEHHDEPATHARPHLSPGVTADDDGPATHAARLARVGRADEVTGVALDDDAAARHVGAHPVAGVAQ